MEKKMICQECNETNRDDAHFCANCGTELRTPERVQELKRCVQCGFENLHEALFCANCGAELKQQQVQQHSRNHSHKQQLPKKKGRIVPSRLRWNPMFVGLLVILGVTLYYTMKNTGGQQPTQKRIPIVETRSNDPKVEASVLAIASKFICSCGTCGEQSLDVCACETAVEERQFIRRAVQAGQGEKQMIAAVQSMYGWIKQQYAAQADSSGRTQVVSTKLTLPPGNGKPLLTVTLLGDENKAATFMDREKIFSQFKCPCGQCTVEELKDCTCNHLRGAQEVKAFVDERIREAKYSVVQLISDVERKYGSRKF
jgi:cytochrome c-type biogenesis protein CcmH/NrfF